MAVCARTVQQPDGTLLLALDPAVSDLSTCAYVVATGAELGASPFSMTAEEGGVVSAGLISCWAIAWGFRQVIFILKGSSHEN